MESGHHHETQRFRELSRTAILEQTLHKAVGALYLAEIPVLVTGGYAAKEYGCRRYTDNVDLIREVSDCVLVLYMIQGSASRRRNTNHGDETGR
jgi:hypothetical protein